MDNNNLNQFEDGDGYGNGNRENRPGGNGNGGNGQGGPGSQNPKKVNLLLLLIAALITFLLANVFMKAVSGNQTVQKSYTEFMQWVDEGYVEGQPNTKVKSVKYASDRIYIELVEDAEKEVNPFLYSMGVKTTYYTALVEDDSLP